MSHADVAAMQFFWWRDANMRDNVIRRAEIADVTIEELQLGVPLGDGASGNVFASSFQGAHHTGTPCASQLAIVDATRIRLDAAGQAYELRYCCSHCDQSTSSWK
jgi:hypothetical protein